MYGLALKIKRLYVILGMLDRSSPPVELFLFGINEGDFLNIGLGRGYVSYKRVGSKSPFFRYFGILLKYFFLEN